MGRGGEEQETGVTGNDLVPVTLLCGFLGSGKTTLLKHVLETKHGEEDFKCAVIVNDMAELNIDKSLIDQIVNLTQKKKFNYIMIEASGVSEPHEIAPLFDLEEHEHDEDEAAADCDVHKKPQLGEVAKLDTCVTVIDSAEFYNNLNSM